MLNVQRNRGELAESYKPKLGRAKGYGSQKSMNHAGGVAVPMAVVRRSLSPDVRCVAAQRFPTLFVSVVLSEFQVGDAGGLGGSAAP